MSRKKQENQKITALYCRISLDDGGDNESMSISNQKIMLRDFAEKNGMFQHEYYVDDGYTGRNFNRPSFQRMIADIEAGKIGCVITKDLSRLGRNYIEAGSYIEIFFPKQNVRYIAITDGVDSLTRREMDITPFKNEASQVDLATGVLAFSCARNIVIVGDLKQLPNVLTEDDICTSDAIWQKHSLDERYRFSTHSLLSSALEIWQDAPVTLLREHYRCHPKIINFCNQKFYHGQLIVMTKDHNEPDVLTMYRTTAGNHARGHLNQRQIDVIQQEVLPRLHQQNFQSIGIITPYRDQVTAIRKQLGDTYEVDTVHKFQGREQDAIILTSVDNVITDFVDDPHMLNVAVSRAVHSLTVVTSQDPRNDQTNYGDLTRYIEYNNFEVIQSQVYSVFDMLYQGYAEQRKVYLQKHKRVSEYDSENLMYSVIQEVLSEEAFSTIGCAVHVSLATLVKDYEPMTEEERKYARNPLAHVDFLLFNQMDKQPVLAIEVDGTGFHEAGSKQAERDIKKNSILKKCAISLLRLRTDGSGEREKIRTALKRK